MSHLAFLRRPLIRHVLRNAIRGRRVDPDDPSRGRFSSHEITQIADRTLHQINELSTLADYRTLKFAGNRLNVFLAVFTASVYRALLEFGVPAPHARDLVADGGWNLYRVSTRPLIAAARLRSRNSHRRLTTVLAWLLRFPFAAPGRPGYEVEIVYGVEAVHTTWTWCPPLSFVRRVVEERGDLGDVEAFSASWCSYDWALNDLLAGGDGTYTRPHTMSGGDRCCDMTWSAKPSGLNAEPVTVRRSDA